MKETMATSDAVPIRGFAWHVYPDPAGPGALAGDSPFNPGESRGPGRPPTDAPRGVAAFWTVHGKVPALLNQVEDRACLVLTEDDAPPGVGAGWFVEPARLAERFELDQRGGRPARLLRVLGTRTTGLGPLQECEFQIDRA
jgi:hypothetical protein